MKPRYHNVERIEGLPDLTIENYVNEERAILLAGGEYTPPKRGVYKLLSEAGVEMDIYVQEKSDDFIPRVWCNGRELSVDGRKPMKFGFHIGLYHIKKYAIKLAVVVILGVVANYFGSQS